jgi:hypothetical protein
MKHARPLISCLILIFVIILLACKTAPAKPPFLGVFSNKDTASGFDIRVIMLMDDGKGMVCGGVGCDPIVWKLGVTNGDIIITEPVGDYQKGESSIIHYDLDKKTITFLKRDGAGDVGPLLFITNEVPNAKEIQKKLRYFDGSRASLELKGAVFAYGITNHPDDLKKLQTTLHDQDLPYTVSVDRLASGNPEFLLIYLRDLDQARKVATKEIAHDHLSVLIRNSKNTSDFEVWEKGKKIRVEPYTGKGVVNTVIPVQLE